MAESKIEIFDRVLWNHTAYTAATMINIHTKSKVTPNKINPYVLKVKIKNRSGISRSLIPGLPERRVTRAEFEKMKVKRIDDNQRGN